MDEALGVLASVPLIDGHNDWPHLIRGFYDNKLDSRFGADNDLVGHVDLKRLLRGRSGGAFWSVYIDCPKSDDFTDDEAHFETVRDTLQQIDLVHRLVHIYRDNMGLVTRAADILSLFKSGKFASLIGVEGLHQIGNSPSILRMYHRLGVRYVTLAHAKNNLYADSATSSHPAHNGLSPAGREMVSEMNRIGMIIDLSHTSESVMEQVLDLSKAPVLFSHSSAASVVASPRNVSDSILKKLRLNGGVIMISFIPTLTSTDENDSGIDGLLNHIMHVANLIGFEHIGLGSDYDGMFRAVQGVDDVSCYPQLVKRMMEAGISSEDIRKILGLNVIRVLKEAEKVSEDLYDRHPTMEDRVGQLWNDEFRATVRKVYPHAEHDLARTDGEKN